MWQLIIPFVILAAALLLTAWAARRFERKERQLGRWDEYGPLEETEPPPFEGRSRQSSRNMAERLEVIGRWKGKVLRRRRPHEKPKDS